MRSPDLRHTVRLRLTLIGPVPEIWRDVVIDRDLSLADLRYVIQAVFEGHTCRHHVFTDTVDSAVWSRTRRRWGDRWTMIDFRDPTVIEEATARIGYVLGEARPLYYGHTCDGGSLVEIEAFEDDVTAASAPPVRVTGGERRTPLACCHGGYEHSVLVGVLADPGHPDRVALRNRIEAAIGPWSHFDPEEFDLADAQRRVDTVKVGTPDARTGELPEYSGPLASLVRRLPRAARAGLVRHLAASGLDLPAFVTIEEARAVTREFTWVLSRAAIGGIALLDGKVDPTEVQAGIEALGCDEERMLRLFAFARRGHLLYSRHGRLVANKRSAAVARRPSELWSLLAREVVRTIAPFDSGSLFLLAIADGSLADPTIGPRRSAEALALLDDQRRYPGWDYDSARRDECDEACDCPSDGSETWHDVVARAIRDAASGAAGDGARPVAAQFTGFDARELGFDPDWIGDPGMRRYAVATRRGDDQPVDETKLLAALGDLIQLLSLFGLERIDDDTWIVPPTLRELARESLRTSRGRASWESF